MSDVIVKSRIEAHLKEDAELVLEELGLTMSDVIRLTFRQIVARRGLPFDVKIPNETTIAAIKQARVMKRRRYKTAKEFLDGVEDKARSKI